MKIAVAVHNGQVAEHFGHCEEFLIYNSEDSQATTIPNPGHKPGFLPNFLGDLGVQVIIAGGMGGGAVDIFSQRNIRVILGAGGDAQKAAEACSRGELASSGDVCRDHGHSHS
ncbi:MAG: dinitrogenase iron-molybdenum cofactor [Desulfobulbus sp.]|nr:dinitrogenase iron-molybdenum cofactor [Desulfobulbus sp.]